MPILQEVISFFSVETGVILLQLSLFSELGVLTRVYLDRLFNDGCDSGWGLCLTSVGGHDKTYGAYFTDLPANMLGCFVMGLLSTATVLGLKSKKPIALLPASHPWQDNKELLVGLRTGFCGSLTTFASWEFSLIQLLIGVKGGGGGQWQQWLWGWIVGFELAFASHLIGEHTALFVDSKILRDEPQTEMTQLERPTEASEEVEDLYGSQELKEVFDGKDSNSGNKHSTFPHPHTFGTQKQGNTSLQQQSGIAQRDEDLYTTDQSQAIHQSQDMYDAQQSQQASFGSPQNGAGHQKADGPSLPFRRKPDRYKQEPAKPNHVSRVNSTKSSARSKLTPTFLACLVLCLLSTALWVVLAVVDNERKHSGRRQQWFALLFAPFGCTLRWLLSKLNARSGKKILPWFPLGTFLANMIACCIDFIIEGITNRYTLGYWPSVVLPAVRVGYAGSLSTVSTFIAEVSYFLLMPLLTIFTRVLRQPMGKDTTCHMLHTECKAVCQSMHVTGFALHLCLTDACSCVASVSLYIVASATCIVLSWQGVHTRDGVVSHSCLLAVGSGTVAGLA